MPIGFEEADGRPVDDFRWLPQTLIEMGRPAAHRQPRRITVELSGAQTLGGIRWGEGPAEVLYLHGGGQNSHTWDLVAALVDVPAIAIDLPGHGHSSWRSDRDYSPSTNAAAVAEALDAWGDRPAVVVGMSLGGLTAVALAAARPDLVRDLVIVDILPAVTDAAVRHDPKKIGAVALLHGPREFDSLEEMESTTIAAAGGRRPSDGLRRGVWHNAVRGPHGRWRWRYDTDIVHVRPDHEALWRDLAGAPASVTLVRGEASPFVHPDMIDRLTTERPDAHVIVAPGAGHAVQSDSPALLAEIVAERRRATAPETEGAP